MRQQPIDIPVGTVFGRLTVIGPAVKRGVAGNRCFPCRCECGRVVFPQSASLRSGRSTACGCVRRKHNGQSADPIYKVWVSMIARCHNPNNSGYKNYGARGIRVCDRWRESFGNFIADVGERPGRVELDRIDVDGHYEPGNVRWATRQQNMWNQRRTRLVTHNGETLPILEWSRRTGLSWSTIYNRLQRGYSESEAVSAPREHEWQQKKFGT